MRALGLEPAREHQRRGAAHVVGVRLEGEPEQADPHAGERAEVARELRDHAPLLQLVDLDHRAQELEVVAGVRRQQLQRADVLGEARAAVADPGGEEAGPDPPVEADAARDLEHVRAGLLADVRDLVDERDLGRQERVRRELDHLGARDVGAHERRAERLVQRADGVAGPAVLAVVADDDAVGVDEVRDRRALLEELRAGDVREAALALLVEHPRDRRGRCRTAPSTSSRARARSRPASPRRRRAPPRGRRRRRRSAACRRRRTAAARARRRRRASSRSAGARGCGRSSPRARARRSAPRRGAAARSCASSMSTQQTSLPRSAKPAAVTRPT